MGTGDVQVEIESLETTLLSTENKDDETVVLYTMSFEEMEENFVKYQTIQRALYLLLLFLASGFCLFMFLYLPVRRIWLIHTYSCSWLMKYF